MPGVEPIEFPADLEKRLGSAIVSSNLGGATCVWCGYHYREYSPEIEAKHFALQCPDAPEKLKDMARGRLVISAGPPEP